jgi:putative transposase
MPDPLIDRKGKIKVIDPRVLAREKRKGFQITQASRLRYRTRYFTDSGIIGSQEFVSTHYQRFKHLFESKNEKIPKPIQGLTGIYSLKKLSERI